MKKNITLISIIISLLTYGCSSSQQERYVCNCKEQKQLQDFVRYSIKNANNMSDEEMEDVIFQLRKDGIKIFCKLMPVWTTHNGLIDWQIEKSDSCRIIMNNL